MKNTQHVPVLIFVALLGAYCSAFANKDADIELSEAWIREAPPVAISMAGYFNLKNGSDSTITVIGFSSPSFEKVELHRTELDGDIAKMVRQDRVEVSPGDVLLLAPGGYHLMLMKPVKPLKREDTVRIQILLDQGRSLDVMATVRKAGA